jgi:hypothetical protein
MYKAVGMQNKSKDFAVFNILFNGHQGWHPAITTNASCGTTRDVCL